MNNNSLKRLWFLVGGLGFGGVVMALFAVVGASPFQQVQQVQIGWLSTIFLLVAAGGTAAYTAMLGWSERIWDELRADQDRQNKRVFELEDRLRITTEHCQEAERKAALAETRVETETLKIQAQAEADVLAAKAGAERLIQEKELQIKADVQQIAQERADLEVRRQNLLEEVRKEAFLEVERLQAELLRLQSDLETIESDTRSEEVNRRHRYQSGLWHELTTPFTTMQFIIDKMPGEDDIDIRTNLSAQLTSLITYVNDLVERLDVLAKWESGQTVPRFDEMDTLFVLNNALKATKLRPDAQKRTIYGNINKVPPVPPIQANDELISMIIRQALDNAIKYSVDGSRIVLDATYDVKGEQAVITVSDDGIGIPPEELPFVQEELFRASNARNHETKGHGIGLALATAVINLHHGSMQIESDGIGCGTRVTFRLPIKQPVTNVLTVSQQVDETESTPIQFETISDTLDCNSAGEVTLLAPRAAPA